MPADAVPSNGNLPGPAAEVEPRFFSPREIYLLLLTVALAAASYVIGGYPLGYIRFPLAVYWIMMGVRYLRSSNP